MIQLDGVIILADVIDIISDLRIDLHLNGINLIADIKDRDSTKDVLITCPVHKEGQERKPSCGVSKAEVERNGRQYPAGMVHCFTCGYTADLFDFVSYCWGTTQRDYGKRYVIRKYNTMDIAQRPDIALNHSRPNKGMLPYKYIDESVLDNYRFTSDYLYSRKFNDNTIAFYEYGLNTRNNTITMPVRDHKGGLVFVKQRLINPPPGVDKYLNEKGVPKQYLLYGFYQMLQLIEAINNGTCQNKKLEDNYKRLGLILTEGEFNSSYLVQCGYPAVSLLGRILFEDKQRKSIQQKELLLRHGIRQLTPWMDFDQAGQEAQQKIVNQTFKEFRINQPDYTQFPELNDANDYDENQLDELTFYSD